MGHNFPVHYFLVNFYRILESVNIMFWRLWKKSDIFILFWKKFIWLKLNWKLFLLEGCSNLSSVLLYVFTTLILLLVCIVQGPDKDLARVHWQNLKITLLWLFISGLSPDFPAAKIAWNSVLCSVIYTHYGYWSFTHPTWWLFWPVLTLKLYKGRTCCVWASSFKSSHSSRNPEQVIHDS